uniref:Uncharacterized protein n=1 Tax=Romanomermis culicivorax TaxID=13658 RepID=A0A915JRM5_ROMCU
MIGQSDDGAAAVAMINATLARKLFNSVSRRRQRCKRLPLAIWRCSTQAAIDSNVDDDDDDGGDVFDTDGNRSSSTPSAQVLGTPGPKKVVRPPPDLEAPLHKQKKNKSGSKKLVSPVKSSKKLLQSFTRA